VRVGENQMAYLDRKYRGRTRLNLTLFLFGQGHPPDPATGKKIRETSPRPVRGLTEPHAISRLPNPDGKHIFSSGRDTLVKIWKLEDASSSATSAKDAAGHSKDWICANFAVADGRWAAAADMAGQVQIWALGQTR